MVMQQDGVNIVGFMDSPSEERCDGRSVAVVCQSCTLLCWRDFWVCVNLGHSLSSSWTQRNHCWSHVGAGYEPRERIFYVVIDVLFCPYPACT